SAEGSQRGSVAAAGEPGHIESGECDPLIRLFLSPLVQAADGVVGKDRQARVRGRAWVEEAGVGPRLTPVIAQSHREPLAPGARRVGEYETHTAGDGALAQTDEAGLAAWLDQHSIAACVRPGQARVAARGQRSALFTPGGLIAHVQQERGVV